MQRSRFFPTHKSDKLSNTERLKICQQTQKPYILLVKLQSTNGCRVTLLAHPHASNHAGELDGSPCQRYLPKLAPQDSCSCDVGRGTRNQNRWEICLCKYEGNVTALFLQSGAVARRPWLLLGLLVALGVVADGFYVPGVAPVEFVQDQKIDVKAVKMTSSRTQLPYQYYSLKFCYPKNGTLIFKSENLGEVLRGDRIVNTPYEVRMNQQVNCRLLCNQKDRPLTWSKEDSALVAERIQHEYFVHLLVDNLPVATRIVNVNNPSEVTYEHGYRLGQVEGDNIYINNHLKFILSYHMHSKDKYRVVGFEVETVSVSHKELKFHGDTCNFPDSARPQQVNPDSETQLYFTYSVEWKESKVSWASRWDIYLGMRDVQIHWFSIINSLVVVFFLSGILTMIMIRTLRRDIARYNTDDNIEDTLEETGWKLVHGDVFRPPKNTRLFSAIIGSGIQIFFMSLITIFFAMLGMLSPSSRGALMTSGIFMYVFMGTIAGYYAARLYKTMKGREWKRAAFLTATLYPGIVFG